MALGPREKSELELHWQHQLDHVRAEVRNINRRLANQVEVLAFQVISDAYNADGTLLDLSVERGDLNDLVLKAVKQLPRGDAA